MTIMVASSPFVKSLYAFIYGYTRLDFKNQSKKIYSMIPIPYLPILGVLVVLMLLWLLLKTRKKKIKVDVDNFLTRRNEGIIISYDEIPGLLTADKGNLAKKIAIAIDRDLIEHRMTANHVFFLLSNKDLDIFTNEVLEIICNKYVWIFTENGIQPEYKSKFEKIGKTIVFDPEYLQTFGNSDLTLGLITRFLSLISRESSTNLDHMFHTVPDFCTVSYSFPLDVHRFYASVLKHQKYLCRNSGESILQITNHEEFIDDFTLSVKLVKADTEPFFISFMEVQ